MKAVGEIKIPQTPREFIYLSVLIFIIFILTLVQNITLFFLAYSLENRKLNHTI